MVVDQGPAYEIGSRRKEKEEEVDGNGRKNASFLVDTQETENTVVLGGLRRITCLDKKHSDQYHAIPSITEGKDLIKKK